MCILDLLVFPFIIGSIGLFVFVLAWYCSPTVVIFGGMRTKVSDYYDLTVAIRKRWCLAHVVVLTPSCVNRQAWADYITLDIDVQWCLSKGFSFEQACRQAYQYSTTVDPCFLPTCLMLGLSFVRPWRRLCCIGVSNGAIPAFDLAISAGAFGLYLASGVPAAHQDVALARKIPRKVATVAFGENYFGGCHQMTNFLQYGAGARVFHNRYQHAREDQVADLYSQALACL